MLLTASDRSILDYAAANDLVIVSADTDFGELLAASRGARMRIRSLPIVPVD
jgi:predicted nuclease of predicted toxin-antitoxin system